MTIPNGMFNINNQQFTCSICDALFAQKQRELTLQRARTAREAIDVMAALVDEYGYCSSGESFTIGDPHELWIMEMVGKGMAERIAKREAASA